MQQLIVIQSEYPAIAAVFQSMTLHTLPPRKGVFIENVGRGVCGQVHRADPFSQHN